MITPGGVVILGTTQISARWVTVWGVAPDARTVSATVPWRESTTAGMLAALDRARASMLAADEARRGALASYEAEWSEHDPMDDPDPDTSLGR